MNALKIGLVSFLFLTGCSLSQERDDIGWAFQDDAATSEEADYPPTDAGRDTSATDPPLSGMVTVSCVARRNAEAVTGTYTGLLEMDVLSHGRPVRMRDIEINFGWSGRSLGGILNGIDTGRPYFTEWYMVSDYPFRIYNNEPGTFTPNGEERRGTVRIDMSEWTEGQLDERVRIRLHTDIAETEEGYHTLTLGNYSAQLDALSFVYADTGADVPASEVSFVGCDNADDFRTLVRADFADMLADRDSDLSSTEVRGTAEEHPALGIFFLNDGAQPGTVVGFDVDAHATITHPDHSTGTVGSERFIRSCSLFQEGLLIAAGERREDTFVFRSLAVTIPARTFDSTITVEVRCTFDGTSLAMGESVQISLSAPYDRFLLQEASPARIFGTLVLEQNHLFPEHGTSVLLRP